MNKLQKLITLTTVLISVHTAVGVLIHDTSIDKAFSSSWKVSNNSYANTEVKADIKLPENNPHTHPEHTQLSDILRGNSSRPRMTPRNDDRKHLLQKRASRGNHTFDGYRLLVDDLA